MDAVMRKTGALVAKDFKDLVKNPVVFICCLFPLAFALMYKNMMGGAAEASPEAAVHVTGFLLSTSLCITAGMVAMMVSATALAEEKEKHTLRTLMLANVGAGQILASRALVSLGAIAVVDAACFFIVGGPMSSFAPYLVIGVVGSIPIVLVSLLVGLASRDQMTASLYITPVFLVALAPMVSMMSEEVDNVVRYFPTGGMDSLVKLSVEGTLFTADAVAPIVITLVWIALSLAAFMLLYKRLTRDN
ncbi:ABC transporter permease [Arabiibacter massiliensis]|uniref:ABC transporter permease n=1 Tax=Arabiibacter massiliensis TaxID=1870985 RepID=UPI0009BC269A|nr:ABC transporter permease [Arabiibacter massiliensis]